MEKNRKFVLNLGSGSIDQDRYSEDWFVIHVDACYRDGLSVDAGRAEEEFYKAKKASRYDSEEKMIYSTERIDHDTTAYEACYPSQILCQSDIFEFIERFPFKFDHVYAERIFEHMEYVGGEIGRLLEGINRITKPQAKLDIVVPNALKLAKMLVEYESFSDMESIKAINTKLLINTEFCNIKADPHASVWTTKLAKEYIESEGTWKIVKLLKDFNFAGRDIYMKIRCEKPEQEKNDDE
jgi:predicted SAM-dependent methyltransferase